MKEKSPEAVLENQIKEARAATISKLNKTTTDPTNGAVENREDRRLKQKYLGELDGLVTVLMRYRSEREDKDGQAVADRLDDLHAKWRHTCDKFNKRPRAGFRLRVDAFNDRIKEFLNLEKEQIAAADVQFKTTLFDKYVRRMAKELKWRTRWYKVKARFVKDTKEELLRKWYDKKVAK